MKVTKYSVDQPNTLQQGQLLLLPVTWKNVSKIDLQLRERQSPPSAYSENSLKCFYHAILLHTIPKLQNLPVNFCRVSQNSNSGKLELIVSLLKIT